jgi:nitrite reductase (NADH) small subunit
VTPTMMNLTVAICELNELPIGLGRAFRVGDKTIAVFRSRAGRVLAVKNVCPHRGGPLADGMLAGEQVVCPLHAFKFHGTTGDCDQPGVCAVGTYAAEVVNGTVYLTLPPLDEPT